MRSDEEKAAAKAEREAKRAEKKKEKAAARSKNKAARKGKGKANMKAIKEKWENMTDDERAELKAKMMAKLEKKKQNATPKQLAKIEEKEKKMNEFYNMTVDEQVAQIQKWKVDKASKKAKREERMAAKKER